MTPLDRSHIKLPTESSPLLSPLESANPSHLWKTVARNAIQGSALANSINTVNAELVKTRRDTYTTFGMHPWKVYQLPDEIRALLPEYADFDYSTSWRTFRVRRGYVVTEHSIGYPISKSLWSMGAESIINGTDEVLYPQLDTYFPPTGPVEDIEEFTLDANQFYLVWLQFTAVNYIGSGSLVYPVEDNQSANTPQYTFEVRMSATPAEDGWTGFPVANPYCFPLAIVDTYTYAVDQTGEAGPPPIIPNYAAVIQLRSDNIILDPPLKFYDPGANGAFDTDYTIPGYRCPYSEGYPKNALVRIEGAFEGQDLYRSNVWFNTETDMSNTLYWTPLSQAQA